MKVTYITSKGQNSFHFTASDSLLVDDHSSFARAEAIMFTIFHLLFLASLAAKSFTGLIVFNSYMIFQFFKQFSLEKQFSQIIKKTRHFLSCGTSPGDKLFFQAKKSINFCYHYYFLLTEISGKNERGWKEKGTKSSLKNILTSR